MKSVLKYVVIVAIMVLSYGTYIYSAATGGSPEELTVAKSQVAEGVNPLGKVSNGSFTNYTTAKEFEERTTSEYLTVTASDIEETGVYMRKGWVGSTQEGRKRSGRGRSRATTKQVPTYSKFSVTNREYMVPVYVITLSGGGEVGALIDSKYVSALEDGETITLPIGQKVKISSNVVAFFAKEDNGGAKINSIYYALDDAWYAENASTIKTMAIVYAGIVFVILMGLFVMFGGKLMASSDKSE